MLPKVGYVGKICQNLPKFGRAKSPLGTPSSNRLPVQKKNSDHLYSLINHRTLSDHTLYIDEKSCDSQDANLNLSIVIFGVLIRNWCAAGLEKIKGYSSI